MKIFYLAYMCFIVIGMLLVPLSVMAQVKHDEKELELYYDFEELAKDQSGNDHEGRIHGNIDLKPGIFGNAGVFDGSETGIELGEQVNPSNTYMHSATPSQSFECLFLANAVDDKRVLFNEGGSINGFTLRIEDGMLRLSVMVTNFSIAEGEFTDTTDWHHIVGVFDEGTVLIYLDGKEFAESDANFDILAAHGNNGGLGGTFDDNSFPDPPANPGEDNVGQPVGQNFDGLIDEVYIYNRALEPDEIAQYAGALAVEPTGKVSTTWANIKAHLLSGN